MHTLASAAAAGVAPTGHARRGTARRRILERPARPVVTGAPARARGRRPAAAVPARAGREHGQRPARLGPDGRRPGRSVRRPYAAGRRLRQALVVRDGQVVGRCRPATLDVSLDDVLVRPPAAVGDVDVAVTGGWSGRLPCLLTDPLDLT